MAHSAAMVRYAKGRFVRADCTPSGCCTRGGGPPTHRGVAWADVWVASGLRCRDGACLDRVQERRQPHPNRPEGVSRQQETKMATPTRTTFAHTVRLRLAALALA